MTQYSDFPEEFEGHVDGGVDWRAIVAWVGDLPPMPHVAARAMQLVEDPDATAPDLTSVISGDTALAARVLKIANSSMFSRRREITTLNQAIMTIGFKALKGIIVAATLRQTNKGVSPLEKLVWENSMSTALCAVSITKHLRKPFADEIFLHGLLHSLGQVVLLSNKETLTKYSGVMDLIEKENLDYVAAEERVLGFAHTLIGALVAKKWNFAADTCQIILHYKDPFEAPPKDNEEEKAGIVQLADMISHAAEIGNPKGYPQEKDKILKLMKLLGFPSDSAAAKLDEIIAESKEKFEGERHLYE